MTRQETIKELKRYFKIQDLVCDHTYAKFGELAWQFLDKDLLETIHVLRTQIYKDEMYVNNPNAHQRGLRCNICPLVKDKTLKGEIYLSAHCNGAGFDHDVKNLTAEQARQKIRDNKHLLPCPVRLEKDVNWVHLDVYFCGQDKIFEFNG